MPSNAVKTESDRTASKDTVKKFLEDNKKDIYDVASKLKGDEQKQFKQHRDN